MEIQREGGRMGEKERERVRNNYSQDMEIEANVR